MQGRAWGERAPCRRKNWVLKGELGVSSGILARGPESGALGRGEAQELRRGAAAQADASAPAPDPGGANIYLATVAKQGGKRREASS